jgi:hypothetical protein
MRANSIEYIGNEPNTQYAGGWWKRGAMGLLVKKKRK